MYISLFQVNVRKKPFRGFPGHSFSTRDTNSQGRETYVQLICPALG